MSCQTSGVCFPVGNRSYISGMLHSWKGSLVPEHARSPSGFVPTAAMRKYAAACLAPDVPCDEAARCSAAGVSPRAAARWRAAPGFGEWLQAEVMRRLSEDAWEVWAIVGRLAREGNLQAAKLFVDRFAAGTRETGACEPDTFRRLADLAAMIPPASGAEDR